MGAFLLNPWLLWALIAVLSAALLYVLFFKDTGNIYDLVFYYKKVEPNSSRCEIKVLPEHVAEVEGEKLRADGWIPCGEATYSTRGALEVFSEIVCESIPTYSLEDMTEAEKVMESIKTMNVFSFRSLIPSRRVTA